MTKHKQKQIRLDRLLSNLGYGPRKEMAMAIKNEWLEIDGERVKDPSLIIKLDLVREGRVKFDGEVLDPLFPFTIMLNKPAGYTCSHKDPAAIVYDLLPERFVKRNPTLSMVGRLDKYSTGLLLLTDDGDLLHRLTHPKSHVPKQYRVTLTDDLRGDEAELFASGEFMLKSDDKPLKPAEWVPDSKNSGIMTLHEGRNRQIRRMFDKLMNEVDTLHRFQFGALELDGLAEGEWVTLGGAELNRLA